MKPSGIKIEEKGQALVEFALILIVLFSFLFIIVESGRLFQSWVTVQNAARAAGRYALTGKFETDCLNDVPACPASKMRVVSIKNVSRDAASGISIDPVAAFNEENHFITVVASQNDTGIWVPDVAGGTGEATRVTVIYNMPIVAPLFRPIAKYVQLMGQVEVITENYDQVSLSDSSISFAVPGGGGSIPLPPNADLELSKEVISDDGNCPTGPKCVFTGAQLDYTITITNHGPYDSPNAVVVDKLPDDNQVTATYLNGVDVFGLDTGCQVRDKGSHKELNCVVPYLPSGDISTLKIETLAPNAPTFNTPKNTTIITNTVTILGSAATVDPDDTNNTSFDIVEIVPWSVIYVDKVHSQSPVKGTYSFDYTITITNTGPNNATGVQVIDTLPPDIIYKTFMSNKTGLPNPSIATVSGSRTRLTFNVGDITVAESPINITLFVEVPDIPIINDFRYAQENHVEVIANEADRGMGDRNDFEYTDFKPLTADVSVVKGAPSKVLVGEPFTYWITVTNELGVDHDPARQVNIVDNIDSNLTLDAVSPKCQFVNPVTCNLANPLPVGNSAVFSITVTPQKVGTVINTASVSAFDKDPDFSNNKSTTSTIVSDVDLELTKTAPQMVLLGSTFNYTLTITNHSNFQATGVTITDNLPSKVSYNDENGCSPTGNSNGNYLECFVGDIAAGQSKTVTISVTAVAEGDADNTAEVSGDQFDNNSTNNGLQSPVTTVITDVDLELTMTAPMTVTLNSTFDYSIVITNNSNIQATGVTITDTLPPEVIYNNVSGCSLTGINNGNDLVCSIGSIDPGQSKNVMISMSADQLGNIVNTAVVGGDQVDNNSSNDGLQSPASTNIVADIDLVIKKTVENYVEVAEPFAYTIVVTNVGALTANNVTVADTFPIGIDYISHFVCNNISVTGQIITCSLGDLGPGITVTITLVAEPQPLIGDSKVTNRAQVQSLNTDADPSNNISIISHYVAP